VSGPPPEGDRPEWAAALAAHRRSIAEFVAAARAVPGERWETPLGPGKWSAAQITEHLRLTYEIVGRELVGGQGLRPRTSWWLRIALRLRFLPAILERGAIPRGARAPRELRPGPGRFPREEILGALEAAAARTEAALAERSPGEPGVMTHHVFGRLKARDGLRFATVHNQHHTRQLAG
jgi:hypothetical protein